VAAEAPKPAAAASSGSACGNFVPHAFKPNTCRDCKQDKSSH
jgi:hypothetical protein